MGLEIEAKYRVDDDLIFSALPRIVSLGQFQFAPAPSVEQQHNTYFDTPDGHLATAGYSLRVREVGGQRTATLKRSRSKQGSLRIRDEWEMPVGIDDDPRHWPPGELLDRVLSVIGGVPTEPLFTIDTSRQHIDALRDGHRVAVLCLDHSTIRAGELAETFSELEVELADQTERPAFDMLLRLLRMSFPLFPEERSKKSRGMALRARTNSVAARPVLT